MRWLSGRASDYGVRGRGFETNLRRNVSLSKTLYSPKVLMITRKRLLRADMLEKMLTATLSLNINKILIWSKSIMSLYYLVCGLHLSLAD